MWIMKASVLIHHRCVRTAVKFLVSALLVGAVVYRVKFPSLSVAAHEITPATIEEHK
jgi:hypothetical protein